MGIRGTDDSPFEEGIYHGRLLFPPQYPMKPPEIFLLTPNGRFETNKKICLSISGYHPETWLPSWSISTALRALQAFFTTPAKGAIGGCDWPEPERRRIAKKSPEWECTFCECKMKDILNVNPVVVNPGEKSEKIEKSEKSEKSEKNNNEVEKVTENSENRAKKEDATPENTEKITNSPINSSKTPLTDSEAQLKQSQTKEANLAERRRIEQTIMRQQIEYQKNDMMSLVFMVILFILVAILMVRKMNKVEEEIEF